MRSSQRHQYHRRGAGNASAYVRSGKEFDDRRRSSHVSPGERARSRKYARAEVIRTQRGKKSENLCQAKARERAFAWSISATGTAVSFRPRTCWRAA